MGEITGTGGIQLPLPDVENDVEDQEDDDGE